MRHFSISRTLLLTGFLIALAFNPIAAQQPTQIERDAIRSACRSDFLTNCASVQPGGKEALECLLQNDSKLSASCKSAVNAVGRKPAQPMAGESATPAPEAPAAGTSSKAATAQAQEDQIKAIRQACTLNDFMAHCSWIQPSSPEVMLCLKANAADLSPACRTAVGSISVTATPTAVETSPTEPGHQEQPAMRKPVEPARASVSSSSPSTTAANHAPKTNCPANQRDPGGLPF